VLSIAVLFVTAPASTSASSSLGQKPRRDQRLNRGSIAAHASSDNQNRM
jgi:hypothetical protein